MEQTQQNYSKLSALPLGTSLATHTFSQAFLNFRENNRERVLYRATTRGGLICRGPGPVSSVGRSPALPSLPPPQLQPPGWQADGLLPELFHDLPDPGQVGFAEGEVALRGTHVIADHAVLGGRGESFRLGSDHVLAGVQEAPVIPIAGCEEKGREFRAIPF